MSLLKEFSGVSGYKVNFDKSEAMPIGGLDIDWEVSHRKPARGTSDATFFPAQTRAVSVPML